MLIVHRPSGNVTYYMGMYRYDKDTSLHANVLRCTYIIVLMHSKSNDNSLCVDIGAEDDLIRVD